MGITPEQVLDVRMSFAGLSRSGVVGVAEIRLLIEAINPAVNPCNKDIEQLIEEASPAGLVSPTKSEDAGRLPRVEEQELSVRFAAGEKAGLGEGPGVRFAGGAAGGPGL